MSSVISTTSAVFPPILENDNLTALSAGTSRENTVFNGDDDCSVKAEVSWLVDANMLLELNKAEVISDCFCKAEAAGASCRPQAVIGTAKKSTSMMLKIRFKQFSLLSRLYFESAGYNISGFNQKEKHFGISLQNIKAAGYLNNRLPD